MSCLDCATNILQNVSSVGVSTTTEKLIANPLDLIRAMLA